jgi:ribosomal-protein-serine acetyltransferase
MRMDRLLSCNGVVIRPHAAHDIGPMFAAIVESMATVGRWMSWCPPNYSLQDATAWYERSAQAWAAEGDREFGIFDASSGEVLGCVGINQINRVNLYGNMGYWVRTSREKRGIASTAARLAASFAFANLGLVRIEIVVLPDNLPSRRVAEKVGARFECIARSRLQFKGETRDAAVYSLVRDDALG